VSETVAFVFSPLDAWALLPVWVLTGAALLVLLYDLAFRGRGEGAALLSLVGLLATGWAVWEVRDLTRPLFGGMVLADRYSVFFQALFVVVGILSVLLSWDYAKRANLVRGEYYCLLLNSTLGMMIMAMAGDLIVFFLGLELMSLALYVLVGMRRRRFASTEAALKYFLLGAFASGFLLYGIAFLYGATGTTRLALMSGGLLDSPLRENSFLLLGSALLLVGFAFKVSVVPFHMWTPDAYEGAPTSVTAFMSAGAKAAGFAALIRVAAGVLPLIDVEYSLLLEVLTVATLVVGNVVAIVQNDLKRMLAYSSIAHAGYVMVGVIAGGESGNSAALLYLVVYSLLTLGSFGLVALLGREGDERTDVRALAGMGRTSPVVAGVFALFLLGLAGIPPTAGFVGKLYLFRAAVEAGYVPLVVVALLASVVSVYYYLRPVVVMYMQEPAGEPIRLTRSAAAAAALLLAAIWTLVFGVRPMELAQAATDAVLGMFP
jgi:NADH-quinone oxidoreductase subunit N